MQKRLLAALRDCGSFYTGDSQSVFSHVVRDEADIRIRPAVLNDCLAICEQACLLYTSYQMVVQILDGVKSFTVDYYPGDVSDEKISFDMTIE